MTTTASALTRHAHVGRSPANKARRVRIGEAARIAENETTIHIDILRYLRLVLPDAMVFHVPNGGLRSKAEAGKLERMGVVAGIPDIVVWTRGGLTLAFEVKTSRGRLSPDQRAMHEWMKLAGFKVAIVRSIDDTREALNLWKIWVRESR